MNWWTPNLTYHETWTLNQLWKQKGSCKETYEEKRRTALQILLAAKEMKSQDYKSHKQNFKTPCSIQTYQNSGGSNSNSNKKGDEATLHSLILAWIARGATKMHHRHRKAVGGTVYFKFQTPLDHPWRQQHVAELLWLNNGGKGGTLLRTQIPMLQGLSNHLTILGANSMWLSCFGSTMAGREEHHFEHKFQC